MHYTWSENPLSHLIWRLLHKQRESAFKRGVWRKKKQREVSKQKNECRNSNYLILKEIYKEKFGWAVGINICNHRDLMVPRRLFTSVQCNVSVSCSHLQNLCQVKFFTFSLIFFSLSKWVCFYFTKKRKTKILYAWSALVL